MRSKWKPNIIMSSLEGKNLMLCVKNLIISKNLIGQRINIYNGKKYVSYIIRNEMVKKKFGEFIVTKILGEEIHIKKKNLKKNK